MKSFVAFFAFLAAAAASTERDQRAFALFNIVQFENLDCTAVTGNAANGNTGKCFSSSECTNMGGTANGNCAAGFGVCCVITLATCGGTVTRNNTYIANVGFTTTGTTGVTTVETCTYTINYVNTDICQLRLDFQTFLLPSIAGNGEVANAGTDKFTVTAPTGVSPPVITGLNTGLHMYVETARSTTATTIAVAKAVASTTPARWNIRVDQIECSNTNRAPTGCTQYFTATSGTMTSYNWRATGTIDTEVAELTAQNYALCVRPGANNCRIQYTATSATSFIVGDIAAAAETDACVIAGLYIPNANHIWGGVVCHGTFASIDGNTVDSAILQNLPFRITYRANTTPAVAGTTGFSLEYAQRGC